jgi:hypothetical protein
MARHRRVIYILQTMCARVMDNLKLTYKRTKGLRLVYEIEVIGTRYRIVHDGITLREATAPAAQPHENALEVGFVAAIQDIERLYGMNEISNDDGIIQPV